MGRNKRSRDARSRDIGGISTSTMVRSFGGLAITLGAILLFIAYEESGQCKMRAIDYSSMNDPKLNGNLIKCFKYTGALLLTAGILTQCIIGPIPDICENCCCCGIGPCIGAILSSSLAKLTLAFITLVLALCNFLGYFWIHMAAKSRTTENSQSPGSPNYCPPVIWYTAHVAVYGLFLAFAILTSRLFAFIYWNFILTEEKKRKRTMYFGPSSKNPALKNRRDPSRV